MGEEQMRERQNDDLGTPKWIVDLVEQMGPIALDPCSNPWSLVRAKLRLSADNGDDGLAERWFDLLSRKGLCGSIFVNPVYSKPLPWTKRIVEAADDGCEVFALMKLDPSTEWSRVLRSRPRAVCDFDKRIKFEGGKFNSGAMASTMVYYGPRPYLFCHTFQDFGEVSVRGVQ